MDPDVADAIRRCSYDGLSPVRVAEAPAFAGISATRASAQAGSRFIAELPRAP